MRFWDSSAIVPLVSPEASSGQCRRWLREDGVLLVWALTATEVTSALIAVEDRPAAVPFVTYDDRLAEAARREGFTVLGG